MAWDFETDQEVAGQLDWMRGFMREEVFPLELLQGEIQEDDFFAHLRTLQDKVKDAGLWAAHLPPELGGGGRGQIELALMHEVIGSSIWWGPIVFGSQAPDSGNAELLALFGSDAQKERWLYPLLDGKIRSSFSMTESLTAGSDPTLLTSTATLDGDEWVINGEKWFSTNGMVADFLIAMVVTDPEAAPHKRASMILVPTDTPGLDRVRNIDSLEVDPGFGYGHAEIIYRDVRVPAANLLGDRGAGFALAQARLGPGRIHHCMRWLGQSQRAFDIMCERALTRESHGGKLGDKQIVQTWIADSKAEMEAARLLTLQAAWRIDKVGTKAAREDISLIKFWGAKVMHDVIDRAIQVTGSLGYSADLPLQAMYRFARAARIYDGADEVHRQTVSRLTLRGYDPPEGPYPTEHIPSRLRDAREKFGLPDPAAATEARVG